MEFMMPPGLQQMFVISDSKLENYREITHQK